MKNYKKVYEKWLDSPVLSESEWAELSSIQDDEEEIKSRFFAPLSFGTAGLRGIMGMGINRMNVHVIRHVTQAFASVIAREGEDARKRGVIICYDCRHKSREFAHEAASVMAGNGIYARIFDALRPTPELSFAIRKFGAIAGINVTASHNPKEYNGYKVYWSDGAQLAPKQAQAVAKAMEDIDIFTGITYMDFEQARQAEYAAYIGQETDQDFLEHVLSQAIDPGVVERASDSLRVVYTPFHGAGHRLVPEALTRLGVRHLYCVPEQMIIDGNFPTVESPNPEEPEGFALAVELARQMDSDLIIGTDPDADRVGILVRDKKGQYAAISGNQIGVLILDYLIGAKRRKDSLPINAAVLKTIVTTEMAREICVLNQVHIEDTFTGFKFIAEKISEYERTGEYKFIMGYEESHGYMIGDFVRDKDAVTASMMIAEVASYYLEQDMTLLDALDSLYEKYGCFMEKTLNLVMPGLDGLQKMGELMSSLRASPPYEISGVKVIKMRDYESGRVSVAGIGVVGTTEIRGSNVLYFELFDGTSFIVRPSGTEPKIKVYLLVRGENMEQCSEKIAKYERYACLLGE